MSFLSWPVNLILGVIWVTAMTVVIVLQRRSAAATIAWLLLLTFLPIVGLIAYRFIGPLRLERKKFRRRASRTVVVESLGALAAISTKTGDQDIAELALVGLSSGEAPPLRADHVEVFTEGAACYASILAAIEAAEHHVHLEYYIWEPDRFGLRLIDLLRRKAEAGVKVRMLVDGIGAIKLRKKHLAPLRRAGGEIAWFNPVSHIRLWPKRRADFRTHRKIVVVDGHVGFTGGMNVSEHHSAEFLAEQAWRDTHLRVEGSVVRALQHVFFDDWFFATDKLPPVDPIHFPPPAQTPGSHIVQILASGPDSTSMAIHHSFFAAMNSASKRLWVTTPYFIPDEPIQTSLVSAALRRVDTRLLIPSRGDSRMIDLAARSYLPELIAAGVKVYEYMPRFLHAKTMVVDDSVGVIGTANLDNRSFRLNFECAAVAFDRKVNAELAQAFEADLAHARRFVADDLVKAPFLSRLGQAGARLMSPLL
jgi:cardiolipin synthase